MKKIFFCLLLLYNANIFAQQYSVFAKIDTTNIRIGEQFLYFIVADNANEVRFPAADSLGLESLELVKEYNVDTIKNKLVKRYLLTGFDSGSFYIPNQAIFINKKAHFTDSLLIKIATVEVDSTTIYPVKGIEEEPMTLKDYTPKFIWSFVIIGIILLGILAYYLYKKYHKKKKQIVAVPLKPPFEEAVEKFEILDGKNLWQKEQTKQYYIELTEVVRAYIGRRFQIHTLEATTEELLKYLKIKIKKQKNKIKRSLIQQLEDFLKHADFVKFAKLRPLPSEIKTDRAISWDIVKNFEEIVKKEEEAQKRDIEQKSENNL